MANENTEDRRQEQETPSSKPYDRDAKIREMLEQDEKRSPFADPFMGF